jgi:hypothetical protein
MAVVTQTRLAAVRYVLVADEFLIWEEASRDDDAIVQYLASSEKVGIDTELELIRARARAMASHMNRDLAFANLQATVARLFNSVGYDAVPREDEDKALAELTGQVEERFAELERASFSPRAAAKKPALLAGSVAGATPKIAALLAQGIERVLDSASMKATDAGSADARLELRLVVGALKEGRKAAQITISVVPQAAAAATLTREFKTTLSDPVADEQWRVLGEGAAYRVIDEIAPTRITRPALRAAQSLYVPSPGKRAQARNVFPGRTIEPLGLRLDTSLEWLGPEVLTVRSER